MPRDPNSKGMNLKPGDVIECDEGVGVIRYIGAVGDGSNGRWLGIELSKAHGNCDGKIFNKRYFRCPAMHGVFVQRHHVKRRIRKEELIKKVVATPKRKPDGDIDASAIFEKYRRRKERRKREEDERKSRSMNRRRVSTHEPSKSASRGRTHPRTQRKPSRTPGGGLADREVRKIREMIPKFDRVLEDREQSSHIYTELRDLKAKYDQAQQEIQRLRYIINNQTPRESDGESVEFRRQTRKMRTNLQLSLKENAILQEKLLKFEIQSKRQNEEQLRMENEIATLSMMLEEKVSSVHGGAVLPVYARNPSVDRLRNLTTSPVRDHKRQPVRRYAASDRTGETSRSRMRGRFGDEETDTGILTTTDTESLYERINIIQDPSFYYHRHTPQTGNLRTKPISVERGDMHDGDGSHFSDSSGRKKRKRQEEHSPLTHTNTSVRTSVDIGDNFDGKEKSSNRGDSETVRRRKNFEIGEKVLLSDDRLGTVRYKGPVNFSSGGFWYGIELEPEFQGQTDGSVNGEHYFDCAPKQGIFVKIHQIVKAIRSSDLKTVKRASIVARHAPLSMTDLHGDLSVSMRSLLAGHESPSRENSSELHSKASSSIGREPPMIGHSVKSDIMLGSKVILNDDRVGIVKYVGEMDFTEGLWYGIELIPPHQGTNDGQLGGKRYFTCPKGQGAFVTKYNLKKIFEPEFDTPLKYSNRKLKLDTVEENSARFLHGDETEEKMDEVELSPSSLKNVFAQTPRISHSSRDGSRDGVQPWKAMSMTTELQHGQFVKLNDDRVGLVQFIGAPQFARGFMYGLEMLDASGNHDGTVENVTYFECPEDCGLFVTPDEIAAYQEVEEVDIPDFHSDTTVGDNPEHVNTNQTAPFSSVLNNFQSTNSTILDSIIKDLNVAE